METVVTMSEEPVQILDETLREQLEESFRCLQKNSTKLNRTSMEIGWDGAFIERHDAWGRFGYKHQHACRTALGISYSNWFRVLAVANCFVKLTKAEYLCMKLDSAEVLGRQPEDVRYDPTMIDLASSDPIEVFKARFAPAPEESKEHVSTFEVKMLREKKDALEVGLHDFMAKNEIDSESYALELLVAEYSQGPTLTGFMSESIPRLTKAVMEAKDFEELRSLLVEHIQAMGEVLKLCCGESSEK